MKIPLCLFLISMTSCFITTDLNERMSKSKNHSNLVLGKEKPEIKNVVGSKYDKCLDKVEQLSHFSIELGRLILNQKLDEILPQIATIVHEVVNTSQCFADIELRESNDSMDLKCVVDHMKKSWSILMEMMRSLFRMDWEMVQELFQKWREVMMDIKNC